MPVLSISTSTVDSWVASSSTLTELLNPFCRLLWRPLAPSSPRNFLAQKPSKALNSVVVSVFLAYSFLRQGLCGVQAGLDLAFLLPQASKYWGSRHAPQVWLRGCLEHGRCPIPSALDVEAEDGQVQVDLILYLLLHLVDVPCGSPLTSEGAATGPGPQGLWVACFWGSLRDCVGQNLLRILYPVCLPPIHPTRLCVSVP